MLSLYIYMRNYIYNLCIKKFKNIFKIFNITIYFKNI